MEPQLLSAVNYPAGCFSQVHRQSKEESLRVEEGQNLDMQKEKRGDGGREGCMEMLIQNHGELCALRVSFSRNNFLCEQNSKFYHQPDAAGFKR